MDRLEIIAPLLPSQLKFGYSVLLVTNSLTYCRIPKSANNKFVLLAVGTQNTEHSPYLALDKASLSFNAFITLSGMNVSFASDAVIIVAVMPVKANIRPIAITIDIAIVS